MRKLTIFAATAALLILTGCAPAYEEDDSPEVSYSDKGEDIYETHVILDDGREITCLVYDAGYKRGAGISCDWLSNDWAGAE